MTLDPFISSSSEPAPANLGNGPAKGKYRSKSAPDSPTKKQLSVQEASQARLKALTESGNESSFETSTPHRRHSDVQLSEREIRQLRGLYIVEHGRLFATSRTLTESTQHKPAIPIEGKQNATDVYILERAVFKPGYEAAVRAEICYGLARLVGIRDAIIPAKSGKATIVRSANYHQVKTSDGHEALIDIEDAKPITGSKFLAHVFKSNDFRVLSNDKQTETYLVPPSQIYTVDNKTKTVTIDNIKYKLKKDPSAEEFYLVPEPSTGRQLYIKCLQSIPNSEFMLPVLVPKNQATLVGEEFDESVNEISFDKSSMSFKAKKNTSNTGEEKWHIEARIKKFDDTSAEDEEISEDDETSEDNDTEESLPKVWVYDTASKKYYNIPEKYIVPIENDSHGRYALQENQKYRPETDAQGMIKLTGTVTGMVQVRVTDIFTTPASSQKSPAPLDILSISPASRPAKAEFYDRIDTPSFIRAFIATILLRPQDGKVADLAESNVLFQAIHTPDEKVNPQDKEVKLRPILIDLDETMPRSNDYSMNPAYIKGDITNIKPEEIANYMKEHAAHAVRCGLMGFPHARMKLSEKEMEVARNLITDISKNKDEIRQYLSSFVKKSQQKGGLHLAHITACLEVIDRMAKFNSAHTENDWTLEDLFFTVFPEYKKHWDLMGNNYTFEEKASYVGYVPKTDLEKLHERRS